MSAQIIGILNADVRRDKPLEILPLALILPSKGILKLLALCQQQLLLNFTLWQSLAY